MKRGATRIPHNISLAWSAGIKPELVVEQYRHEINRERIGYEEVRYTVAHYYAMLDSFMVECTKSGIDWSYVRREG